MKVFKILAILLLLCPYGASALSSDKIQPSSASEQDHLVAALETLFDDYWEFKLKRSPVLAESTGEIKLSPHWPNVRPEQFIAARPALEQFQKRLRELQKKSPPEPYRTHAEVMTYQLEDALASIQFKTWEIPMLADSGFHTDAARRCRRTTLSTPEEHQHYLQRLRQLPDYFDQQIENMRSGVERGFSLPQEILGPILPSIHSQLVEDVTDSDFYAPLLKDSTHASTAEEAKTIIKTKVIPAYQKLFHFMKNEYIPAARTSIGASQLPLGEAYYEQRVRHFTTLPLTPKEIHEVGLKEVSRIREEMESIIQNLNFEGSFDEFLTHLRTNPKFYAQTPQQLLERAAWLAKSMDAKLPSLIGTLPRKPYGVAPVPDAIAKNYTGGRYVPPAEGTDDPGYYWVNTYALESRPLYTLPALTLHEAVPGHHLQISLASEQGEQPAFRRYDYISAYGEGWALYAEWLGVEVEFYQTPYEHFGRLTYEMWRACRLVVDTGMHAFGWTSQQARDYLTQNTALSMHEINTEVDRYIAWPAQALSYKIGEMKIRELRMQAESALGDQFDRKQFHDVILASGSVPLIVVEQNVARYIEQTQWNNP